MINLFVTAINGVAAIIVGFIAQVIFSAVLSIPLYFCWNYLAPIYLPNIPEVYQQFPFFVIFVGCIFILSIKSLFFAKA